MDKKVVFVTDGYNRKSLSAVRSFGEKGFIVYSGEENSINITRFSKHVKRNFKYFSPNINHKRFIDSLIEIYNKYPFDVLFPTDDEAVLALSEFKSYLPKDLIVPIGNREAIKIARDKSLTMEIAEKIGIPVPKTLSIKTLDDIDKAKNLNFPILIKPRESSGSRGIAKIGDYSSLRESYLNIHKNYPFPMIQEYITPDSEKFHICFLLDKEQNIMAKFTQKVIRQYPVNGGVGTFWQSTVNNEIEELAFRLLKEIKWYGVALVEFIIDKNTGRPVLMEINPRLWNTLSLSIDCGVDFPYLMYLLESNIGFKPVLTYEVGRYGQWLFPGEFLNFLFNKDRFRQKIKYIDLKDKNRHDAIISKKDIMPFFGLFVVILKFLFDKKKWIHVLRLNK
ncbi:MAG: ATP-grasp domain-containing protein [Deltaproteobacteria bacterium]|nr:ATP-grasp domain-containing protein [Deltaproteobacteria bacterium]